MTDGTSSSNIAEKVKLGEIVILTFLGHYVFLLELMGLDNSL